MNKVITIVIPTYNMERYLDRCLNSLIIAPDLMDKVEVLVINDGSKDRSSEIGHSYEAKFPNTFQVIDKENGNYGSCINRGLKEATGNYIKILDADDYFDTAKFEELIKLLEHIDVDGIISDMQTVDMEGMDKEDKTFNFTKNKISTLDEIMECPFNKIPMHCIAYNTDNLRLINYHQTEGISYTDMEWIFMPMTTCKNLYYFPQKVYYYVEGRSGQTMDKVVYKNNFWQDIKVQMSMIDSFNNYGHSESAAYKYLTRILSSHSRYIYRRYFVTFRMQVCYEDMVEADKYLCQVSPTVAKELEELYQLRPFNYHYVKKWRKYNYPKKMLVLTWGLRLGDLKKPNNR